MKSPFLSRPDILHAIDRLDLRARKKLSALFTGDNESRQRGSGIQFSDFRPYEWGDDTRHISWTTSAKTGKIVLKSYEEEKELNLCLAVDISGSSLFGSSKKRKIDMYSEVSAVLGLSAFKHGFRVGCLFFDEKVQQYLPPTRKKEDFLQLINTLPRLDILEHQSSLPPALSFLFSNLKHKSLVVILSDFLLASFQQELQQLSVKHEIILLRGYDDAEHALTTKGVFEICDPESGHFFLLDSESSKSRQALQLFYTGFSKQLETIAHKCRADLLPLSTQDDYLQRLVVFFDHR